MTASADRYRKVADEFTARAQEAAEVGWDRPAPCEGWVARDVVRHLVEWVPGFFFGQWGISVEVPSVDDDPVAAWAAVDAGIRRGLDDPSIAQAERDTPMGPKTFESALDMICTSDVLVHTWDLARACGLDERLDPDEVHQLFVGMEPIDEMLRTSGHFGPKVTVPDDADEQTKLLAFTGRTP